MDLRRVWKKKKKITDFKKTNKEKQKVEMGGHKKTTTV